MQELDVTRGKRGHCTKYATAILQALWARMRDGDLVRALARGTSEKALWRIDGGKIAGGR